MTPSVGSFRHVLAIETSCDDTSVAIVRNDGFVCDQKSATKDMDHAPFGGIVPEIASRNHSLFLLSLVDQLMKNSQIVIDGVAVTNRPGLVGSLIVGLMVAKTFAFSKNLPFVGVNHLEGHLFAADLFDSQMSEEEAQLQRSQLRFPILALAVSGGHSIIYEISKHGRYRVVGQTVDDAAGEAFDKFGKMMGFGFPGGVRVDRASLGGDKNKFYFPRGLINEDTCNLSFSGLKSAADRLLSTFKPEEILLNEKDLCASFQWAIVEVLLSKVKMGISKVGAKSLLVTGGVSANSLLRRTFLDWAKANGFEIKFPPLRYCTDNAAMIGLAGISKLNQGFQDRFDLPCSPNSYQEDFGLFNEFK